MVLSKFCALVLLVKDGRVSPLLWVWCSCVSARRVKRLIKTNACVAGTFAEVFDGSVTPRWRQGETAFMETVDIIGEQYGHELVVKIEHGKKSNRGMMRC